jgi:hypothetical protein
VVGEAQAANAGEEAEVEVLVTGSSHGVPPRSPGLPAWRETLGLPQIDRISTPTGLIVSRSDPPRVFRCAADPGLRDYETRPRWGRSPNQFMVRRRLRRIHFTLPTKILDSQVPLWT